MRESRCPPYISTGEPYICWITKLRGNRVFALNTTGQDRRSTQKLPSCQAIVWITEWGYRTEPNSIITNICLENTLYDKHIFTWFILFCFYRSLMELLLTCWIFFVSIFSIISWSWINRKRPDSQWGNHLACCLSCIVNTISADALAIGGARVTTGMILTQWAGIFRLQHQKG